jgi:predicted exporter
MSSRERFILALSLLAALGAGLFVALRFEMDTDVTSFLPEGEERDLGQLSRLIARGELSRTVVLTLGASNEADAVMASRAFEAELRGDPAVMDALAFLEGGPPEEFERAIFELYFPHRLQLLARSEAEAREKLSDDGLRRAASTLRDRLAQPMSTLLTRVAPADPFLTIPSIFESLEQGQAASLRVADGRFVTRDGRHAVLFLGTRAEAFDTKAQAPLFEALARAFHETRAAIGGSLTMDQSGIHRFALRAEREIKADVARITIISVLVLVAALLLLFRSVRFIALASLPIGAGVLAGLAIVLATRGRIHGITLAFGASLIGVTVDYVLHLYCHHAVMPDEEGPRGTLRAIDGTLLTCAAATILGFVALLFSSLPGLREVALFSTFGIATSLAVTRTLVPSLLPHTMRAVPARDWLIVRVLRPTLGALRRRRGAALAVFGTALVFVALTLPSLPESRGFGAMGALDPELLDEDQRVRDRVTRYEQMRFVVARGADEASALEASERAAAALEDAVAAAELDAFHGIARLLPSPATQRASARAMQGDVALRSRFEAAFAAEGFVPVAFAPFFEALEASQPAPLTFDELLGSPLSFMVRSMRLELDDGVAFITYLSGVHDEEALARRFAGVTGAHFLRQGELFGRAEATYRARTLELLSLGLLAVFALIAARQKSVRKTLAALGPALLAALVTLGALAVSGRGVDLVTLTTLLIVVCMGVDYGLFLVDAEGMGVGQRDAALLAIFLAAISTLLGFGLLSMSHHPVLSAIGLTACAGIFASLVLAPAAIGLAGLNSPRTENA